MPRVIAVVGPGLIGTSVVLAARRAWPGVEVRTIDQGQPLELVRGCDIVVLAAPVDAIIATLPQLAPVLSAHALVIDTGSTKRAILAAARAGALPRFIGGHPMAGGATTGPLGARADLFDGKPWFLIGPHAPVDAKEDAAAFITGLGARPVEMQDLGEAHDALMAAVSHLPQLAASALMIEVDAAVGREGLHWAGTGLRDTTRLAASSADVWQSILLTNRDEVGPLLKLLAARLGALADRLDDREEMARFFEAAARAKSSCL